jgi:hypothetical protein
LEFEWNQTTDNLCVVHHRNRDNKKQVIMDLGLKMADSISLAIEYRRHEVLNHQTFGCLMFRETQISDLMMVMMVMLMMMMMIHDDDDRQSLRLFSHIRPHPQILIQ